MFRLSLHEIIAGGIPMLGFAFLARDYPVDVQCVAALWGGWLGLFAWFVILRLEYINPYKFVLVFMLLPGFLLASLYYVHRKPMELASFEASKKPSIWEVAETEERPKGTLPAEERSVLLGLAVESGWVWLTGSALLSLLLSGMFIRLRKNLRYSLADSHRSRALLGRTSTSNILGEETKSTHEIFRTRVSPRSDVAADPRIREIVKTKH